MPGQDGFPQNRFEQVAVEPHDTSQQGRSNVTTVHRHADEERRLVAHPDQEVYRQALRVMLATPEIERRMNYITAGMIVAVFTSWLAGAAIKTRAVALVADTVIIILGSAVWGLLVGVLIGEGVIPVGVLPVLLYLIIGALFLLLVVLFLDLVFLSTSTTHEQPKRISPNRKVLSPSEERR